MAAKGGRGRGPAAHLPLESYFADDAYSTELEILQNPDRGRKFASKDKRPLDPPPIVRLRIWHNTVDQASGAVTRDEVTEFPPHRIQGLLCHLDLYKATSPTVQEVENPPELLIPEVEETAAQTSVMLSENPAFIHVTDDTDPEANTPSDGEGEGDDLEESVHAVGALGDQISAIAARLGPPPPTGANASYTRALFGTLVAQARPVVYDGVTALLFVFGDIAVRLEGYFFLRYTVFDVFGIKPGNTQAPVLASATSTRFEVYSSKAFPGLQPSTDLTKLVLAHGIPVHIRQDVRKRNRPGSPSAADVADAHPADYQSPT